jgi:hypothetical protein
VGGERIAPLFRFKRERLFQRNPSSPFYSYGDGFYKQVYQGTPQLTAYAYFAPTRTSGYDGAATHCDACRDGKGNTPAPMKDGRNVYWSTQSFQIMSSGKNLLWGTARQWVSGAGVSDSDSADNITNFAGGTLAGG